jgi:hypothetical protein
MIKRSIFIRVGGLALCLFLAIILNSLLVQSLGITPSRVTLKFVPNYVYEGQVCYTLGGLVHLNITVEGEFKDNLELLNVEDGNFYPLDQGCLKYKLKMPASIVRPGIHRTKILSAEVPEAESGFMVAVVRMEAQIDMVVPYPGKYLEITDFSAQNADAGKPVLFTLSFINKGIEAVDQARATILIYDRNNTQISTVNAGVAKKIEPDETRQLSASWDSGAYKAGNYHAYVELSYDDGAKNNATTNFKLGGLNADITNYTKEIIIGGIKEFYATVDSIWSETIHNVRVVVNVYNYSNSSEPITSFETLTRDISPWGTESLKGYLDTSNLKLGEYDLKMKLSFEDINKEYDGKLKIIKEPEIKPKSKTFGQILKGIFTIKVMLIMLALLLLITIAILIYVVVPKKRKEKERK